MTCLISVGRSGKYCCLEAPQTKGELQHLDLNSGALIFKAANLPPTPLLVRVGKEWVDSGLIVGESACTVVCKPGCYRLAIDCSDYEGIEAPETGATELCYEYDKQFDKVAYALEQAAVADDTTTQAMLDCLAELKLLTAANNDAMALAEILAGQQELLESLQELCDKLLNSQAADAEQSAAQLACLEDIKSLLETIQSNQRVSLGQVCYQ